MWLQVILRSPSDHHKITMLQISNGGIATATTVHDIKMFKLKKGNGHRAKGGPGKTCSKCSTSHPQRECPVWCKKCHKCGNKNHFSMCCRTRDREDPLDRDQHRLTHRESQSKRRSRSRLRRYAWEDLEDRSRSTTQSAHSIEWNSFQDHPELHWRHSFESNNFVKKTFHSISRSKFNG